MHLRLSTSSLLLLVLACKPSDGAADETGTSTAGGDESLGMGVTSASQSDPTVPTSPTSTDATTSTSSPTDPTTPTTTPTTPTTITAATDLPGTDADPSATDGTLSDPTTATDGDTAPACPNPGDLPQGAGCTDPSGCECASGRCFLIPVLGGLCGECLVDADCPGGGCTIPDPVHNTGSACNKGEAGAGCMSDAVCNDPTHPRCAVILDVPGIITVATCSACDGDADCPIDAPHCTPVIDLPTFSGVRECRPDASLPNDHSCEFEPGPMGDPLGDAACQSGFCGTANVMGILKVGICGACDVDADCPQGQTCTDPIVDLENDQLVGAFCQ